MRIPSEVLSKLILEAGNITARRSAGLISRPIAQNSRGIFEIADGVIGDTCHFTHVDRSLNPEFLKGLLKIEGKNPEETYTLIKDEMLKAMGYKHPDSLGLLEVSGGLSAYHPAGGHLYMNLSEVANKKQIIALIRHELDHMDKYVKMYKAKGKDAFAKIILGSDKKNYNPITIEVILKNLNTKFYETMSKDVSIEGFDAEKYYRDMLDYQRIGKSLESKYKYYNSELEKDAYAVQRKVLEILGEKPIVLPDTFPSNYPTMLELLNKKGIPKQQQEDVIDILIIISQMQELKIPNEDIKKSIILSRDFQAGKEISAKDKAYLYKIFGKITHNDLIDMGQKPYQQIEKWLREGKFSMEDVLNTK